MTQPLSTDLLFRFYFKKLGVPYNPTPAPTLALELPDGTQSTPALANPRTGEYTYTHLAAGVLLAGAYIGTATTTDATADYFASQATWEVGTNDVASIWGALTATLTTVGSIGKWILDNAAGTGPTVQQIVDGVMGALTTSLTVVGSYGKYIVDSFTAVLAKVNQIGGVALTAGDTADPSLAGTVMVKGASYMKADGRSKIYTVDGWPGATLHEVAYWRGTRESPEGIEQVTGEVIQISPTIQLEFEFPAAITNILRTGTLSLTADSANGNALKTPNSKLTIRPSN